MPGASSVEPTVGTAPGSAPRRVPEPFGGPRYPEIGGLSTPWGIYLVQGNTTAGVGPSTLVLTGFLFGTVEVVAVGLYGILERWIPHFLQQGAVGESVLVLFLVVIWMTAFRLTSLAGHHAAEHQVVHAAEFGVPLTLEAVERMDRVHPRCGTRLAAAVILLTVAGIAGELVGLSGYVLGGLGAMRAWAPFGRWLQERVTTRPASRDQLLRAIDVLHDLEAAGKRRAPVSVGLVRRLMLSGLPFLALGAGMAVGVVEAIRFVLGWNY